MDDYKSLPPPAPLVSYRAGNRLRVNVGVRCGPFAQPELDGLRKVSSFYTTVMLLRTCSSRPGRNHYGMTRTRPVAVNQTPVADRRAFVHSSTSNHPLT